jgi:hypothetical protein
VVRKSCGHNVRAGSTPASATTKPLSIFIRGFFVFVNIYSYISGMKNPFENLSREELMELLTKTDIPQKWINDEIFNKKVNNDRPKNTGSSK